MKKPILVMAAAMAFGGAVALSARADPVADFYAGKTITILVGYGAGGTYGQYAEVMSHYLPQFIPGHPNMVIQYMPGAGGLKSSNYAYNVLPKDGTALLEPTDTLVVTQLTDPKHARYNSGKFTWIGNMIDSNAVICVRADTGVRNLAGAEKKQIIVASTGTGSQTYIIPAALNAIFHTKFKIVMGYKGSRGSSHAMEQNEVQGFSSTWLAFQTDMPNSFEGSRKHWKAYPIVQVGFTKDADLQFVDLAQDFAKTGDDRQILDFISTMGPIGRGLTAPPGTPERYIAALRKAFQKMIKDPAVRADVNRRKLRIIPKSGEEVQKVVEQVLTMSPAVVKRAAAILKVKTSS